MGLLWTTEGTRRIINTLNTAFDGPGKGLQDIRNAVAADPSTKAVIVGRQWGAGDLATALDLFPYDQGNDNGQSPNPKLKHRTRWLYFLKQIVGPNATVFGPLRNALADAILNQDAKFNPLTIVRVTFDHVELEDLNASPNIVIFDLPNADKTATVRHITLFTIPVPQTLAPMPLGTSQLRPLFAKPPWQKP